MCSREILNRSNTHDPTRAVIEPLIDAYRALKNKTVPVLTRLQELLQTADTAPRRSVTTEAACLEALGLIGPARTTTRGYLTLHTPLFDAPDPIVVLRRAGVVFEGDANAEEFDSADAEKLRDMIQTMARLARSKQACLERFESRFRAYMDGIRRHEWVNTQLDDMILARHGPGGEMSAEEVEEVEK